MKKLVCCIFLIILGLTQNGFAAVVPFTGFSNTGGLQLNGTADYSSEGNLLRMTKANVTNQAGSVFSQNLLNTSSFSTYFTFTMTSPAGPYSDDSDSQGADGIVFVIQNVSNTFVGGNGGGIGYSWIGNSLGVEFDTWQNGYDPDSNHIGINTNGRMTSETTIGMKPNFDGGDVWHNWIDYDGTSLEVRSNTTGIRPADELLSYEIDIQSIVGSTAYVGFTSATGGNYAQHDILSWEYEGRAAPVPVPGSILLLGSGLLGLASISRRTKV